MTTGRINQVSAYHLRPARPGWAHTSHKRHLHKGFVREQTSTATRAMHQRVAYPFKSRGKAQGVQSARLDAQTSPGKLAPTLQISPIAICPAGCKYTSRSRSRTEVRCHPQQPCSQPAIVAEWGGKKDVAQSTDLSHISTSCSGAAAPRLGRRPKTHHFTPPGFDDRSKSALSRRRGLPGRPFPVLASSNLKPLDINLFDDCFDDRFDD